MSTINHTSCCGVKEIDGISSTKPKSTIRDVILRHANGTFGAVYIFTSASEEFGKRKYGEKLKKEIEKMKLGHVYASTPTLNLNSGNMLTTFLWTVDLLGIEKYIINYFELIIKENNITVGKELPGTLFSFLFWFTPQEKCTVKSIDKKNKEIVICFDDKTSHNVGLRDLINIFEK